MFIDELPEECLLIIFYSICELDDLINCFKVCSKWSHLIAERTRKVKYLVDHHWRGGFSNKSVDCVYYRTDEPIDGTCLSTLFPNLIIADLTFGDARKVEYKDIVTLVKKTKLKGLLHFSYLYDDFKSIYQYINELEMVATHRIHRYIRKKGASIKQLHLWSDCLNAFNYYAHYFPNIESLFINKNSGDPDEYYDGPILRKLKIVELSLSSNSEEDINYDFQFMDSCPNLQSAYIYLHSNSIFIEKSLKNRSLQDLVIDFYCDAIDWKDLKRLFRKYPNLKHLALRNNKNLNNAHVEKLIHMLPKLELFDVRKCPKVTQKAYNYVQDFCELYERSIRFYFDKNHHKIQSDWPQLSTQREIISQGFDFMKHCFLKRFHSLPTFLVPIED